MQTLIACLPFSPSPSNNTLNSKPNIHSLSVSTLTSNPSLSNFLIDSLYFSEPLAISISSRFPSRKSLEKPHSVVHFLKQLGFSDAHIRSAVRLTPNILFSDVDKTLKPKLQFLQDLGLTGPDLGKFISTHSQFLHCSLERTLIPCVDIIKKTLVSDENNQDLIRILQRSYWAVPKPVSRLKCNIAFLESCGIDRSQLSKLLKVRPWSRLSGTWFHELWIWVFLLIRGCWFMLCGQ